ncbi:MAG: porin family protein, partial [Delftia sp.]|nr:porin family protein [Delftia sp.]
MVTCLLSGGGLPLHRVVLRSCVRSRPNRRGQGVFLQWRHSPKRDCMKHVLTFTALILTASG